MNIATSLRLIVNRQSRERPVPDFPLNGDPLLIAAERAVSELRHGRVLALGPAAAGQRTLLVSALETATAASVMQLRQLDESGPILAMTAERARALGFEIGDDQPVLRRLDPECPADLVAALGDRLDPDAWRGAMLDGSTDGELRSRAGAPLLLARRAQLLPAILIATPAALPDPQQVLTVTARAIERLDAPRSGFLSRSSEAHVPLPDAERARFVVFRDLRDNADHVAVIFSGLDLSRPVPVRVHSSCLTGDLMGSLRCDCGEQLRSAVAQLSANSGVLLYLSQEGRGIGLANKLRAYRLQDSGLDTVDANRHLGFGVDERNFAIAAEMLRNLGISSIELLTNNPDKVRDLVAAGIDVAELRLLPGTSNPHNAGYLRTKRERAGHLLAEPCLHHAV